MTRKISRVAAALILPAVLATAACGKQADPTPSASASAGSVASSAVSPSGPAAVTSTTDAPADAAASTDQPYKDKASLIAGLKAGSASSTSAHVSMDMNAAGQSLTMQGDTKIDAANPAMKMSMDMGSQLKLEMILIDKKVFIKGIPGVAAGKWAVADSSSELGKQMAGALAQGDPTKMYAQFDKAVTDVSSKGEETVDGEKTWKYELTLDTSAMGASLPAGSTVKMPKTITYLAWIDADNHLRKVTFDVMGSKATMLMSKYGEPVDITAPAAADTVKSPM
ncbi:MAG: LppX_LprAFG lipoprotein [Humibacillus sp.]